MPLFPRFFSNTFRFSPLQNQTTVLPKANLQGSKRLVRLQNLLNEGANLLDDYQATGRHQLPSSTEFALKKEHATRSHEQARSMNALKEVIQDSLLAQQATQFFEVHKTFRNPLTWDGLRDLARLNLNKTTIEQLKNQWMRHAPYSHFSPEGLLNAARCLDKLCFIVDELKREALNYADYSNERKALNACMSYLNKYKKTLNEQQNYIAEALSVRILHALDANNLKAHEPLSHLLNKLQGLVPKEALPQQYTPLDSTLPLASAFDYCLKKGSPFVQNTLKKALSLGQHNPLIVIQQANQKLLIPQSLAAFIPKKPPFFARFSTGHQLRYEFFKSQQQLLFKMAAMHRPSDLLPSFTFNDVRWKALEKAKQVLSDALYQADLLPLKKTFYKQTSQFIHQWKTLLNRQSNQVTLYKMEYLRQLADTPQPLSWASSFGQNASEMIKIRRIIKQMNTEVSFLDNMHQDDWLVIKSKLEKKMLPSDAVCLLNNAVNQLKLNKALSDDSFDKLAIEFKLMTEENKNTFKNHHSEYSRFILNTLFEQLTRVGQGIGYTDYAPDSKLILQSLMLLRQIDEIAHTPSDLSVLYPPILAACKAFKELNKQMSAEEIQHKNITEFTSLLTRLAFSNPNWKVLHRLISDAKEYQHSILNGKEPQTADEIVQSIRKVSKETTALIQKDTLSNTEFIENLRQERQRIERDIAMRQEQRNRFVFLPSTNPIKPLDNNASNYTFNNN